MSDDDHHRHDDEAYRSSPEIVAVQYPFRYFSAQRQLTREAFQNNEQHSASRTVTQPAMVLFARLTVTRCLAGSLSGSTIVSIDDSRSHANVRELAYMEGACNVKYNSGPSSTPDRMLVFFAPPLRDTKTRDSLFLRGLEHRSETPRYNSDTNRLSVDLFDLT